TTRSVLVCGWTSVAAEDALLLGSGSTEKEVTVAALTAVVGVGSPAGTVNAVLITTVSPGRSASKLQGNGEKQSPEFPRNWKPAGRSSSTWMCLAIAGPRLVTTMR